MTSVRELEQWRRAARVAREHADAETDPKMKGDWLEIAEGYEYLVKRAAIQERRFSHPADAHPPKGRVQQQQQQPQSKAENNDDGE